MSDTPGYIFDLSEVFQAWGDAYDSSVQESSWTGKRRVQLGNGESPAKIAIPENEKMHPAVGIYCHAIVENNTEVFQVVNTGIVIHDNTNPDLELWIAHPPGETMYHTMLYTPTGMAKMKGVPPAEVRASERSALKPEQMLPVKLVPNDTLTPTAIGGIWMKNNVRKTVSGSGPNFSSHIPPTTGKEWWVLVAINASGGWELIDGTEFDIGSSNPATDAPDEASPGYKHVALVKLTNGDTAITESTHIVPLFHVPVWYDVYEAFEGDSGAGGAIGLVPAPSAGDAAADKFLHADGTWQEVISGAGDVVGPASSTNNAVAVFDGTTGKLLKNSAVTFPLSVPNGGTGINTIPAGEVLLGDGTNPIDTVAPGASGNVLTSTGSGWTSQPSSGSSGNNVSTYLYLYGRCS